MMDTMQIMAWSQFFSAVFCLPQGILFSHRTHPAEFMRRYPTAPFAKNMRLLEQWQARAAERGE